MFNNAGIMHPEDDNALNTEERIWYVRHGIIWLIQILITVIYQEFNNGYQCQRCMVWL